MLVSDDIVQDENITQHDQGLSMDIEVSWSAEAGLLVEALNIVCAAISPEPGDLAGSIQLAVGACEQVPVHDKVLFDYFYVHNILLKKGPSGKPLFYYGFSFINLV